MLKRKERKTDGLRGKPRSDFLLCVAQISDICGCAVCRAACVLSPTCQALSRSAARTSAPASPSLECSVWCVRFPVSTPCARRVAARQRGGGLRGLRASLSALRLARAVLHGLHAQVGQPLVPRRLKGAARTVLSARGRCTRSQATAKIAAWRPRLSLGRRPRTQEGADASAMACFYAGVIYAVYLFYCGAKARRRPPNTARTRCRRCYSPSSRCCR